MKGNDISDNWKTLVDKLKEISEETLGVKMVGGTVPGKGKHLGRQRK